MRYQSFAGQWIAYVTLVGKEFRRMVNILSEAVFAQVISMLLYFLVFGKLVGQQIREIQGFPYIIYIVPGLIIMGIINSAYLNTIFSVYLLRYQKSIEELLISPLSSHVFVCGMITIGIFRALLIGTLTWLISLLFTPYTLYNGVVVVTCMLFTSLLFALGGSINGLFIKSFGTISIVPTFVLTPFIFLGGVFYSLDQLSPFWRKCSYYNPIVHLIGLMRYGMLGIPVDSLWLSYGVLVTCLIGLYLVNISLVKSGKNLKL